MAMRLDAVIPELLVAGGCLLLIPLAGWLRGRARISVPLGAMVLVAAALVVDLWMIGRPSVQAFDGTYAVDALGKVAKAVLLVGGLVSLGMLWARFRGGEEAVHGPVALLFSLLGAMVLTSAEELVLIILFFQMMSMAAYVLVALVRTDDAALEAAIKYFLYGAVALALLAYGLTFLYGLTGFLDLKMLAAPLAEAPAPWLLLALLLVVAGYGFEASVVPFHFWAPDTFEGASAPVAGFVSVVPKVAALVALARFLVSSLPQEAVSWPLWIAALSALSMTYGNLLALRQLRLKRLLAYSSIAQAGYMLMAVAVAARVPTATVALVYYLAVYTLMNLGAFAVVAVLEREGHGDAVRSFGGLGRRRPWLGAVLTVSLLSLAGIPPFGGFFAKVLLFDAVLDGDFAWLAVVAAANMVIGLYYYLRVVGALYLEPAAPVAPRVSPAEQVTGGIPMVGVFLLGVVPGPFYGLVAHVMGAP